MYMKEVKVYSVPLISDKDLPWLHPGSIFNKAFLNINTVARTIQLMR